MSVLFLMIFLFPMMREGRWYCAPNGRSKLGAHEKNRREKVLKLMLTHHLSNTYHGSAGQRLRVDLGHLNNVPQLQKMTTKSVNCLTGLCHSGSKQWSLKSYSVLPVLFRKCSILINIAWCPKDSGKCPFGMCLLLSNCSILKRFSEKPMSPIKPELLLPSKRQPCRRLIIF